MRIFFQRRSILLALLACGCLTALPASAQSDADQSPSVPPQPTPRSLVSVSEDLEALLDLRGQMRRQLVDATVLDDIESSLDDLQAIELREIQRQAAEIATEPHLVDLLDIDTAARDLYERLSADAEALDSEVRRAEKDLEEITERRSTWGQLETEAIAAVAPATLYRRIEEAQQLLAELEGSVRARRDRALEALDQTTELKAATGGLREDLSLRISALQRETLASASQPIWRIDLQNHKAAVQATMRSSNADLRRVSDYARSKGPRILLVFAISLMAALALSLLVRRRLAHSAEPEQAIELAPALAHPASTAILIGLIAARLSAPPGPQVIQHLFWALMALPAAHLAASIFGRRSWLPITLVTATVVMWPFRAYFEAVPLLDRALLLAEDAAGIAAALLIVRRGIILDRLSGAWQTSVRVLLWFEAALLTVSFVAGVFGEVGLARLLRNGAVVSLGLAMVIHGIARALLRIIGDLLRGPVGDRFRIIRAHPESALNAVVQTVIAAALAAWTWLSLEAFQLTRPLLSAVESLLQAGIEVGWFNLTVGEALSFFAVIAAAFVIAKVICYLLDEEFLPRLPLGRGVPYMISTSVRYLILLAGFTLALAALGIDLSKATILAGAFGVGLGFGLQNVVNNFVSGLILLFERPIRVGDVVELAGVRGEVSRIGIRSSTVSTGDGSEVIVPNGDLISKDVTNWTLTSRRRLVEVLLGVAHGSDPRKVKEILERVAGEHAEVMDDPSPRAFFIAFGDSRLDFRLICWVADYGDGYRVASELRMAVAEAFETAGIEIALPQQDLRIVSGGAALAIGNPDPISGGGHSTT